ncbi:MAG TPA: Flp pilus assembly protein CpaB [Pirellulaceae bacterium]|jgi:pilus assembly protein CpaB|nr:Flp pilus assembly protein CpaB [Pirellulaceae bacterium]
MRGKSMILIVVALGCGLVASIGVSQVMTQRAGANSAGPETAEVYVASADVNINDPLDAKNVTLAVWPKDKIPEGAVTEVTKLEGQYARSWIYQGELILEKKLTNVRGDNVVIPEGFRVMPLQVEASRMSKLIKPGDRVDVMLYVPPREGFESVVKTILADVRVFSVNAKVERAVDEKDEELARFVDVLCNPEQSEVLTLAAEMGSISLSLRRPDDPTVTKSDGTAMSTLMGLKQERSTEVREASVQAENAPPGDQFREWLDAMNERPATPAPTALAAVEPEPVKPVWTMVELTPEGPVEYEIGGPNKRAVRKNDADADGNDSPVEPDATDAAPEASEAKALSDRELASDPNLLEYLREQGQLPEGVERTALSADDRS